MKQFLKNVVLPRLPFLVKGYFPTSICIEPTNRCNLKCVGCPRRNMTRSHGDLSFEDFQYIIDQIPTLKRVSLFFMGEPLLNPDIWRMVRYAEDKAIRTLIATNSELVGHALESIFESGLSQINFSLDGMSQATIETYRVHSSFKRVFNGINAVLRDKKNQGAAKPHVKIRFLVLRQNEHEIPLLTKFASENNVELSLVRAILDYGLESLPEAVAKEWLPLNPRYQRYTKDGNIKQPAKYCSWIWTPLVTWDGDVIPCCIDTDAMIKLGNVFEEPFNMIYWSRRYMDVRRRMMRKTLPICRLCKETEKSQIVIT